MLRKVVKNDVRESESLLNEILIFVRAASCRRDDRMHLGMCIVQLLPDEGQIAANYGS